jgi:hypothetical protein
MRGINKKKEKKGNRTEREWGKMWERHFICGMDRHPIKSAKYIITLV